MKIWRYGLVIFFFSMQACSCGKLKRLDQRVSLWRLDKIPYGTKYAYDNLPSIFPSADIRTSNRFPILFQPEDSKDTTRVLIILTPTFDPEPDEMNALIHFAALGNHVFISARYFGDTVLHLLRLKLHMGALHLPVNNNLDSSNTNAPPIKPARKSPTETDSAIRAEVEILNPASKQWMKYAYPGDFSDNYFDELDTGHTRILGQNRRGEPDFIRITYAHEGALYIHLEPRAFSNFFLLHNDNKQYYDQALSWMPQKTGAVEWSDYFRYRQAADHYSALHFLLGNRSLRWAFWLTLALFLLLFLVESKRKQRPIAEIPRLRNASEDFVKTVGRLYYQQKNNQNLASKMITAFLENVRSAYNLQTSVLDSEFAHKLAYRTGRPFSQISELVQSIHDSRLKANLTDKEILDLHHKINQFNKPAL